MGGGGGGYTGGITKADKLKELAKQRISKLTGDEKSCNIFIPHAWDYDEEYQRLLNLLEGVEGFEYKDYSVPKDDPIETKTESKKELEGCTGKADASGKRSCSSRWNVCSA